MAHDLFCPKCGAPGVNSRGAQVQCKICGEYSNKVDATAYSKGQEVEQRDGLTIAGDEKTRFIDGRVSDLAMTDDQLLRHFEMDPKHWKVDKAKFTRIPIHRKAKANDLKWNEKGVVEGWSKDSGDLLVKFVYGVHLWVSRRTEEIKAELVVEGLLKRLSDKSPKVKRNKYKRSRDGLLLEMMIPDIHIGRITKAEESDENYNIELAHKIVHEAVESMLHKVERQPIERILFPLGNDFFNVDNEKKTTAAGTPQQEEANFAVSFMEGERLMASVVDRLSQMAPVDLVFMPGNHDPHRVFYLGRVAEALYGKNKNVNVTNSIKERQYYNWGRNTFCLTHGDRIKLEKLPSVITFEMRRDHPDWLVNSRTIECHMGHVHHKKEMEYIAVDEIGVTFRFFRSLTSTDRWHFQGGWLGSPKGAESILWSKNDSVFGQYPATIRKEIYQ